ncbi:pre-mRNA 3'-end-processing factor FIP1-like [Strongylocentrotus purpuratus]|uniref:Pre-mRNA polyadenylation factor Fip1 domain-containing protein n=1 Tax=Strongylocentrotus purpuratus TaxID=7668 RepID=A0A7M7SWU5_STRPU|nr:pre-mRNA 3'-end-processing factor FIP1-like [Strongylocentrotus purpuratus]
MAEEDEDSWLYGDGNEEEVPSATSPAAVTKSSSLSADAPPFMSKVPSAADPDNEPQEPMQVDAPPEEGAAETQAKDPGADDGGGGDDNDDDDDDSDDSDDDSDEDQVEVTIGPIKTGPTTPHVSYGQTAVKHSPYTKVATPTSQPATTPAVSHPKPVGKGLDIEAESNVNGVGLYSYELEAQEDKPWRKPGADLTDYFNYGFNEESWTAYCEKQRRLRSETGGVSLPVKNFMPYTPTASSSKEPTTPDSRKLSSAITVSSYTNGEWP